MRLYDTGKWTHRELGAEFSLNQTTISSIILRHRRGRAGYQQTEGKSDMAKRYPNE